MVAAMKAEANIKKTWEDLLRRAHIQDKDAPLVADCVRDIKGNIIKDKNNDATPLGIFNPLNPVVGLCNYIYQVSLVYYPLNHL